jgi:hypothetical protein
LVVVKKPVKTDFSITAACGFVAGVLRKKNLRDANSVNSVDMSLLYRGKPVWLILPAIHCVRVVVHSVGIHVCGLTF